MGGQEVIYEEPLEARQASRPILRWDTLFKELTDHLQDLVTLRNTFGPTALQALQSSSMKRAIFRNPEIFCATSLGEADQFYLEGVATGPHPLLYWIFGFAGVFRPLGYSSVHLPLVPAYPSGDHDPALPRVELEVGSKNARSYLSLTAFLGGEFNEQRTFTSQIQNVPLHPQERLWSKAQHHVENGDLDEQRLVQDPESLLKALIPRPGSRWFNGLNAFAVIELLAVLRQAMHVDDNSALSYFYREDSDTSSIGTFLMD
jgi:hypothetical protein